MLTREALITRINASLAWLESYLKLNAAGNLNTSSVLAEDLCIRLLNLVYDHQLKNANAEQLNAPAVDLVPADDSARLRIAYQITINDETAKIRDTHKRLASHPDIAERFDAVIILFLVRKAPAEPKASASFTPCTRPAVRSLDLAGIVEDIRALPLQRIEVIADALDEEMKRREPAPHVPAPAPVASEAPPPAPGFLQFLTRSWADIAKALGCLAAVIIAWQKIPALLGVEPGSSTGLIAIGIAAVPLLCYLLLDALPRWREARYRATAPVITDPNDHYFKTYPQPAPADGQPITFTRPDKAEQTVLDWIESATSPLLHFTGASGTGKSSLLDAFVLPHLRRRDPAWHIIKLRSFDDPLAALAAALPGVWQKPPAGLSARPLSEQLTRAAAYLHERNRRLLLVFDQFEELFILHPVSAAPPSGDSPAPLVHRVRDLLTAVTLTAPLPGLTVLLSYRSDHRSDIDTLRLPARNEDHEPATRTAFEVQPFTFAAARDFLTRCPGLTIPPARLQQALAEAAAIDENSQRVRPIVLNLLGRALQYLAENPRRSSRRGRLLHDYIRTHAFDPREEHLPQLILPRLLSEKGTIAPATAPDIAAAIGKENKTTLTAPSVTHFLSRLRAPGLVRQIGTGTHPQWEIAHDFIARLIHLILGGTVSTLWRKARPWLAPSFIAALLLGGGVLFSANREREALRILGDAGFDWRGDIREAKSREGKRNEIVDLQTVGSALRTLNCKWLDLSECKALRSLEGLEGIHSLQSIDLSSCTALKNLNGLKGLTSLHSVDLSLCVSLSQMDSLKGLTSLKYLNMSNHMDLIKMGGLREYDYLQNARRLNPHYCANVDVLKDLTWLEELDLGGWYMSDVDGLSGLKSLEALHLNGCDALTSVEGLKELRGLRSLNLGGSEKITRRQVLALKAALPDCKVDPDYVE